MLELTNNQLVFRFPEVHPNAVLVITLHRTLRIPDDGKEYPLPPSLGSFPMVHIDDYKKKVSPKWVGRGGVMIPMYQSEAMWFSMHSSGYPFAVKCATGKVSAITGKKWSKKLKADDYMVTPGQPWLDGYVVADGTIRQFVAAPLGLGVTAEAQITGKEEFGGLQLEVIPMKREVYEKKFAKMEEKTRGGIYPQGVTGATGPTGPQGPVGSAGPTGMFGSYAPPGVYCSVAPASTSTPTNYSSGAINVLSAAEAATKRPEMHAKLAAKMVQPIRRSLSYHEDSIQFNSLQEIGESDATMDCLMEADVKLDMGLAAGGRMRQQVFKDPHGVECWDSKNKTRVFIHLANSVGWQHVTGALPPHPPLSAALYTQYGYRWFDYYEENAKSHGGTEATKGLKSLAEIQKEKGTPLLPENQPAAVKPQQTVKLKKHPNEVRGGSWAK